MAFMLTVTAVMGLTEQDVRHSVTSLFYVNPVTGQVRISSAPGVINSAHVLIGDADHAMNRVYQDQNAVYFEAECGRFDTSATYRIIVRSKNDSLVLPAVDAYRPMVPWFETPAWAAGAFYYCILPDGFDNGEVANDPAEVQAWGTPPEKWIPYGGDLKGILRSLPYLDSLGVDVIVLGPLCRAPSNHKFDPVEYGQLDPTFGDTNDLRSLITAVHRREMKIVMKFVVTHTGTGFGAFDDVMKSGRESRYFNWYHVTTTPPKINPAHYACWRQDARFPMLNLGDPAVRGHLIGYLEYWRRFGFDGFWLGEDPTLDPVFAREVRQALKAKQPDLLLLGMSNQALSGEGMDGAWNPRFEALVRSYFVDGTILTSQFDQELRKTLLGNPAQANCLVLHSGTDLDGRLCQRLPREALPNYLAFLFTCCGSPLLWYGDEIGLAGGVPLNLGSFPWGAGAADPTIRNEILKLNEIRHANPALRGRHFYTLYTNDISRVYAYDRGGIVTVLNLGASQAFVSLPAWDGAYLDLVTGEKVIATSQLLRCSVAGRSYRILRREF